MFVNKRETRFLFIAILSLSSIAISIACRDSDDTFQVGQKPGRKTCQFFEATIRCERFDEGKRLCPVTCDACGTCVDSTGSFFVEKIKKNATCNYFKKKTVKRCASHAEGRENCRLTCVDTCRDAPTAAPTAVGCKNSEDAFDVAGKGEKKCSFFVREPSRCDRFSEGKVHCRETCGGCGNEICQDRATSFPVEGKETDKTCNFFRKATSRCDRFPEGKQFCKVSCGLCEGGDSPTKSPTKAPTKFPTIAPTKSPTKFPTIAPTKAPTTSPTTLSYSYSYSYSYSFSFSYSMDG